MKMQRTALWLRIAIAVAGLVPVSAGVAGVVYGAAIVDDTTLPARTGADGHFRYLSGLLLAIGLGFWSAIPAIENRTARCRMLAALVFVGGIGRLIGLAVTGEATTVTFAALTMELVVTPLLCLWQTQVSRAATRLSIGANFV